VLSSIHLFENNVLYKINELKKKNRKGIHMKIKFCDKCNQKFSKDIDDKVYCFICGHKYHSECVAISQETDIAYCKFCMKNELEKEFLAKAKSLLVIFFK